MPSNAVSATIAHCRKLQASGQNAPQTLARFASAAGYPGNKASSVRATAARNVGAGAQANGYSRYAPVTPAQAVALLTGGQAATRPQATKQVQAKAKRTAHKLLLPKVQRAASSGAKQAKRQAATAPPAKPATAPTQAS